MRLRARFPVTRFCPHTPGTEGVHSFYYKDPLGANRIFTKTRVPGERDVRGRGEECGGEAPPRGNRESDHRKKPLRGDSRLGVS